MLRGFRLEVLGKGFLGDTWRGISPRLRPYETRLTRCDVRSLKHHHCWWRGTIEIASTRSNCRYDSNSSQDLGGGPSRKKDVESSMIVRPDRCGKKANVLTLEWFEKSQPALQPDGNYPRREGNHFFSWGITSCSQLSFESVLERIVCMVCGKNPVSCVSQSIEDELIALTRRVYEVGSDWWYHW